MTDRRDLAHRFLNQAGWASAHRKDLAGDASNRRYERLTEPNLGKTAVLMDSPPGPDGTVHRFVEIANHLRLCGLSAPAILAENNTDGFLLLEDLGDDLFARVLTKSPMLERRLYETATDVLTTLHQSPLPDLEPYCPHLMTELAGLALSKYAYGVSGPIDPRTLSQFTTRFSEILERTTQDDQVLIQRDYHAENLLWLPDRIGVARVGLLDFQDAMRGHRAYDLVSLLQDARRDVPKETERAMIDRYISETDQDDHRFRTAYAVLGAQRNLRIMGIFARLSLDYGKLKYIDLIPRVWGYLMRDLEHPALEPVSGLLRSTLPSPTAANLARLKSND